MRHHYERLAKQVIPSREQYNKFRKSLHFRYYQIIENMQIGNALSLKWLASF